MLFLELPHKKGKKRLARLRLYRNDRSHLYTRIV